MSADSKKKRAAGYFRDVGQCLGHLKDVQEGSAGSGLIPSVVSSCSSPSETGLSQEYHSGRAQSALCLALALLNSP